MLSVLRERQHRADSEAANPEKPISNVPACHAQVRQVWQAGRVRPAGRDAAVGEGTGGQPVGRVGHGRAAAFGPAHPTAGSAVLAARHVDASPARGARAERPLPHRDGAALERRGDGDFHRDRTAGAAQGIRVPFDISDLA